MKTLFIGNSYTQFNNLPGMLQELAGRAGKTLETTMVTSGGKTLEWHWYNPETIKAVDRGGWDAVVLQEQSQRPIEEPDKLKSAVERWADRIRKVKAKPVLYLTWARQHLSEMQDAITEGYTRAAEAADARVAPVGLAWREVFRQAPDLVLHTDDRSHPNHLGSYLAACVFYATLLGETPVGLSNETRLVDGVTAVIDADKAALLQNAAWSVCQSLSQAYGLRNDAPC